MYFAAIFGPQFTTKAHCIASQGNGAGEGRGRQDLRRQDAGRGDGGGVDDERQVRRQRHGTLRRLHQEDGRPGMNRAASIPVKMGGIMIFDS